jgi:hypothetical protein
MSSSSENRRATQISALLPGRPYALQIAKDGKWENPLIIKLRPNSRSDHTKKLAAFLGKEKFESLAIEAMFKDSAGLITIFGMIYSKRLPLGELDFLAKFADAARDYRDFGGFISDLNKHVIGKAKLLLSGTPDIIRIGIVNHWFSTGPIQLWEKDKPRIMTPEQLENQLAQRPEIAETKLNFQGLSFIFNRNDLGVWHYVKPGCSRRSGGKYRLDKRRILFLLKELADFKIA